MRRRRFACRAALGVGAMVAFVALAAPGPVVANEGQGPSALSIARSTAMLAAPPRPQPWATGTLKVSSVAVAFVTSRTAVVGKRVGFGSGTMPSVPVTDGLSTTGLSVEPM